MGEKKFDMSVLVDGVKNVGHGRWGQLEAILEFETPESVISAVIEFLDQIDKNPDVIRPMLECVDKTPLVYGDFRKKLIQILEEKFGCKVIKPEEVSGGEIAKGCPRFFRRKSRHGLPLAEDSSGKTSRKIRKINKTGGKNNGR